MAQITVITSAYNVGAYIERYVSSLKSQHSKISSSFVATIIRATIRLRNCESFAKTTIDFKLSNRLKTKASIII